MLQRWNGIRPSIKPLLPEFYIYLADLKMKEIHRRRKRNSVKYPSNIENNNSIKWIEMLLKIPLADHRKYALWRIIAPYLINIKKLFYDDAFDIIFDWLNKCSKAKSLDFNMKAQN